jgi:hypothetical protein
MNEFHKINCPHCGQSIEYPAEGRGQNVPCPTCEKRIDLPHASPAYEAELSAEQKSKLRYFGLVFDESCSAAWIKTAIVEYQKLHPEKKDAYYNRPATPEQIAELRKINREEKLRSAEVLELGLTYRKARDLLYKFGAIQIENKEKRLNGPPSKAQGAWLKKQALNWPQASNLQPET